MTDTIRPNRREFIQTIGAAGALFFGGMGKVLGQAPTTSAPAPDPAAALRRMRFSSVSVARLPEIQRWLDGLDKSGKISGNATFRSYIKGFDFTPPKKLPTARSIVILSLPQRMGRVVFHWQGKPRPVMVPTGYIDDGLTLAALQDEVVKRVFGGEKGKLEPAPLPLKTMAVGSGLAQYGKNNITFVEGFGSNHMLVGFYTDRVLPDQWRELRTLRECKGCSICMKGCPTQCIREENFVIDVNKCVTLYNEVPGTVPVTFPAKAHNALMGCLKCQLECPANEDVKNDIETLAELDEKDTHFLLRDGEDKKRQQEIIARLKRFPSAKNFPLLRRNLRLVLSDLLG